MQVSTVRRPEGPVLSAQGDSPGSQRPGHAATLKGAFTVPCPFDLNAPFRACHVGADRVTGLWPVLTEPALQADERGPGRVCWTLPVVSENHSLSVGAWWGIPGFNGPNTEHFFLRS